MTMQTCADALRDLRGIADRLDALDAFGNGTGLTNEQTNVVRLVQRSNCPALKALAQHAQHDNPDEVLPAWRALVVDGLEPLEPTLPKVAAIEAQSSGGVVRAISTTEPTRSPPATVPMNLWIDHARRVVAVLIARVERCLSAEQASPADRAFGAARAFVEHLATLAYHARRFQPTPDKPDAWKELAGPYAMAFVAWFDLTHQLTPAVRTEASRVYPPGSPAIKLGKAKPTPTVIEAVADELGVYFRNAVYAGRRHPLEPDWKRVADGTDTRAAVRERLGIKTQGDGWMLMVDEWKKQDRERGELALSLLRCESIDFDDLQTQLIREAEAVIAAASKPNAQTIDHGLLQRLEAGIAAVGSLSKAHDERMARVEQAVTSIGMAEPKALPGAASGKLPELKAHDRQAWQLATLHGMTQDKVAAALNKEHGTTYIQWHVSRMIARAKAHADANGLAEKIGGKVERPRTINPGRLELGARVDKRKPRPSDTAQADDDNE